MKLVAGDVLSKALRVDEIGDVERATQHGKTVGSHRSLLAQGTRYPFVISLPSIISNPSAPCHRKRVSGRRSSRHKLTGFSGAVDSVVATFETPDGPRAG